MVQNPERVKVLDMELYKKIWASCAHILKQDKEIESVIVNPTDFLQLSFMHKNACNGSDQPIKYIFGGVIYKSEDMPRGSFKVYSKN